MKKCEELVHFAPEPVRPTIDAKFVLSVQAAEADGRYIKGQVLTAAVWDDKKEPFAVWHICGEEWTGKKRGENSYMRAGMRPVDVVGKDGYPAIYWRDIATGEESAKLLSGTKEKPIQRLNEMLNARNERLRRERNERQAEQTKLLLAKIPPEPADLKQRILQACSDAVFLWFTNDRERQLLPGGVSEKVRVQHVRCDSCGSEYTLQGWPLEHRAAVRCERCNRSVTAYKRCYGAKKEYKDRTFLLSQRTDEGVWIRRYLVGFSFESKQAELMIYPRGIYFTDGKKQLQWRRDGYYWEDLTDPKWKMVQHPELERMMLCPSGWYQSYMVADRDEYFEDDVSGVLGIDWVDGYIKNLNILGKIRIWRAIKKYPMAESLIKTGWGEAVYDYNEQHGYGLSDVINMRSKTYYGVFGGLNRQELQTVVENGGCKAKLDFKTVVNAVRWKKAGMAITAANLKAVSKIYNERELRKAFERFGAVPAMKYLRQQTRRIKGEYVGLLDRQVTSDWLDFIDMAGKAGMNLTLEKVRFPIDLTRRHNELMLQKREMDGKARAQDAAKALHKESEELENKFHVSEVLSKVQKTYAYESGEYCILVPQTAEEILRDSEFLNHCVRRGERYFERISVRESYIFFLRKKEKPDVPWYTLEVEPGGTVRQKRSYNNEQYADLDAAKSFIAEWQQAVQGRMSAGEISLMKRAHNLREEEFAELRKNGNVIRAGRMAGKLLVDELMADLMEVNSNAG